MSIKWNPIKLWYLKENFIIICLVKRLLEHYFGFQYFLFCIGIGIGIGISFEYSTDHVCFIIMEIKQIIITINKQILYTWSQSETLNNNNNKTCVARELCHFKPLILKWTCVTKKNKKKGKTKFKKSTTKYGKNGNFLKIKPRKWGFVVIFG